MMSYIPTTRDDIKFDGETLTKFMLQSKIKDPHEIAHHLSTVSSLTNSSTVQPIIFANFANLEDGTFHDLCSHP